MHGPRFGTPEAQLSGHAALGQISQEIPYVSHSRRNKYYSQPAVAGEESHLCDLARAASCKPCLRQASFGLQTSQEKVSHASFRGWCLPEESAFSWRFCGKQIPRSARNDNKPSFSAAC